MNRYMIAMDCGNSSFRVVLGIFDGEKITTELISQTEHDMILVGGYLYWDMLRIYEGLIAGLKTAAGKVPRIDSVGICTWGIDFAFYRDGFMLSNPLGYRNTIGGEVLDSLTETERKELFFRTGISCDKINSIYMLMGIREKMPGIFAAAEKLLLVPDILNYMLTGTMKNEPSELSTTQLMDVRKQEISTQACTFAGIDPDLFCEIGKHGTVIGSVRQDILQETGISGEIPVICVPSHDTAAAAFSIPAEETEFLFISSGTWSAIGAVLEKPVINEEVYYADLTNETGAFGKTTLLKNNAGMYLLQRMRKEWMAENRKRISWDEIVEMARSCDGPQFLFDVNDSRYFNPENMSEEIRQAGRENGIPEERLSWNCILRAAYESLAESYARLIRSLEKVTAKEYKKIYIVGGASANAFLNKLTAERTGKEVVVCSREAASLGVLEAQLRCLEPGMDPDTFRRIQEKSV